MSVWMCKKCGLMTNEMSCPKCGDATYFINKLEPVAPHDPSLLCSTCGYSFGALGGECKCVFEPTPAAASILTEAASLISGDRRDAYGDVHESFERLAMIYTAILKKKLKEPITAHEAALLGVGLKLARESNKPARDNRVDLCGYAALADQIVNSK